MDAARIPEIVNESVVSLNFSEASVAGTPRQIKARVFEVCASGGLLLSEATPGLEDYLRPGVEVVCFDGEAQLVEQARRLLSDASARDAIAAAGHARVAAEHTYERRFAELLALHPNVVRRTAQRGISQLIGDGRIAALGEGRGPLAQDVGNHLGRGRIGGQGAHDFSLRATRGPCE